MNKEIKYDWYEFGEPLLPEMAFSNYFVKCIV